MNNTKEISLSDIERTYDVEKLTLNGECIWPVLRIKVNEELRALNGLKSRTFKPNAKIARKLVKTLFYGVYELFRIKKYDNWVFSSSDRRKIIEGVYVDRVAEPFATGFENTLMIENPYPLGFHYKKKEITKSNIVSQTPLFLGVKTINFFFRKKLEIGNEEVILRILENTGLKINYQAILKNHLAQYRLMKLLLRIKTPKLVCFVYAASSMGFIKALKEFGVPVLEIQHGIINAEHYAYNYPKDFGKYLTPDYLLTYSKKELEIFGGNNFFIDSSSVFSVGYYYIDAISRLLPKNDFGVELHKKYRKIVAFSLQDPFEEYTFDFLREVALLDASICYLLIPRNVYKSYDAVELEENLVISKDLNVYECLQLADFHATINSTCAIEALYFGVPNILFDFKGWASSYYQNILDDEKHTMLIKSPEEFIAVIDSHEFYPKTTIVEKSRLFIERNFSENIKSVVNDKILGALNER